jgi:hypothetical protein
MENITISRDTIANSLLGIGLKKNDLDRKASTISTVCLGSSHEVYGFDPRLIKNSINPCSVSQDLSLSLFFYRYCVEKCINLKEIVLFFSIFSPGFELVLSSDAWRCACVKAFYEHYQLPDSLLTFFQGVSLIAKTTEAMISGINSGAISIPELYAGMGYYAWPNPHCVFHDAPARVNSHLDLASLRNGLPALEQIVSLSQARKINLLIVTPPYRSDYMALLPPWMSMFSSLAQTVENMPGVYVKNAMLPSVFKDEFFGDTDHLIAGGPGSTLLTRMIANLLFRP